MIFSQVAQIETGTKNNCHLFLHQFLYLLIQQEHDCFMKMKTDQEITKDLKKIAEH